MASISKSEASYIHTGLLSEPPLRADGRALHEFRSVSLETGVAPLANGSAHVNIGKSLHNGGGGTEVLAAAKLEVENIGSGQEGVEGGRVVCSVSCSPAAYPHVLPSALDDLQADLTTVLHQTLAHRSLHPSNLTILPGKKSWVLNLDCVVLSDAGNIYDALFMAARAALCDCKVPRTRGVQYKAPSGLKKSGKLGDMEVDSAPESGFDTRSMARDVDFELVDTWDEGEQLDGQNRWPVSVTLNVPTPTSVHYLDAALQEEAATPMRLLLAFSFQSATPPNLHAMRTLGTGELELEQLRALIAIGEKHAKKLWDALNGKLKEENIRRGEKARANFARR
ncbi:RNase-PH domain-containing protein [Mycena indigotica]|uniref:Ribosomal RNA-processing protein 42 n=1 Tax=Mycena indigotica TaxID=2126181 RepID=A0A8H6TC69_9AGAR|nr:RNase-PH domain-containing protein [Mycena indigotica]KAF7315853.1 RNase-PH domain-containing protein [Mycena indigotica]